MNSSFAPMQTEIKRRMAGNNIWIARADADDKAGLEPQQLSYDVLESEEAVGRAMLAEIETAARKRLQDWNWQY